MKPGKYYYGDVYDPALLTQMLHPDALKQKIEWATELILKLDAMPLFIDSEGVRYPIRDMRRRNRAVKAIRDNQKLLEELK